MSIKYIEEQICLKSVAEQKQKGNVSEKKNTEKNSNIYYCTGVCTKRSGTES